MLKGKGLGGDVGREALLGMEVGVVLRGGPRVVSARGLTTDTDTVRSVRRWMRVRVMRVVVIRLGRTPWSARHGRAPLGARGGREERRRGVRWASDGCRRERWCALLVVRGWMRVSTRTSRSFRQSKRSTCWLLVGSPTSQRDVTDKPSQPASQPASTAATHADLIPPPPTIAAAPFWFRAQAFLPARTEYS